MPRKKSIKKSADKFISNATLLETFVQKSIDDLSGIHQSWCYEYAMISLYREFEQMILSAIIGAINNNSTTISQSTGVTFPKHLTYEVCEYLVLGGGYFSFKGRDGLIKNLEKYVPKNHYLVRIVKKLKYKGPLEKLIALRNFAAHNSKKSKRAALAAIKQKRIKSAGYWLKLQGRYGVISMKLIELGQEIRDGAPY